MLLALEYGTTAHDGVGVGVGLPVAASDDDEASTVLPSLSVRIQETVRWLDIGLSPLLIAIPTYTAASGVTCPTTTTTTTRAAPQMPTLDEIPSKPTRLK
mmetsp:Transcript_11494/g.23330  ORF Transcript_11494/g.23330 Transcript_11494/m.23330 type:complete len:100 (+) Transcript_11494:985-1284(+)